MADTTNATCYGGIFAPHCSLSDAKISIISETSKHFAEKLQKKIDAGPENLRPKRIEFLQ